MYFNAFNCILFFFTIHLFKLYLPTDGLTSVTLGFYTNFIIIVMVLRSPAQAAYVRKKTGNLPFFFFNWPQPAHSLSETTP